MRSRWSLRPVALAALAALCAASPAGAQPAPGPLPPVVMTGFDPRRDGLPFTNTGDYASPDGNCWGMSLLAIDAYLRRRDAGAVGEPRPVTSLPREGYGREQLAASWAQAMAEDVDDRQGDIENPRQPVGRAPGLREALARIAATGVPEVMSIEADDGAHATVLHGFRDGALHIYDPNYPGETIRWPYDPATGRLGPHPKRGDAPLYRVRRASSTPFARHRTAGALARIRALCAAEAPACVDRFPRLAAALEPAPDGRGLVVTGTVGRGMTTNPDGEATRPVTRVWVAVNGQPVGEARVSRFGTFRVPVPPHLLRPGEAATVRVLGEARSAGGDPVFGGVRDLAVGPAPAPRGDPPRPGDPSRTRGLVGAVPP